MKYGINTLLFTGDFSNDTTREFSRFKEIGFDGVEIAMGSRGDFDEHAVLRSLKDNGLVCSSICGLYGTDRDLRSDNSNVVATCKTYIRDCIDCAVALESSIIVGPMYSAVGRANFETDDARELQWKQVVENLGEMATYAEERKVTIAVEPLNRFETDFLNTCADAVRLAGEVNSPALKIHLDTFHMNIEEKSSFQAIKDAGDNLVMLHASENDRGAPGTGQVHWNGVADAIELIDYNGWIVIESFTPNIEIIAKAASIWRQTEPDAYTLAEKGLRFLKETFTRG